jgi:hypothetical protein
MKTGNLWRHSLITACLMSGATGALARQAVADPPPVLLIDVNLSEWWPPMSLRLDTGTGRYSKTPPRGWWPDNIPRPQAAQGTLRGAKLANVVRRTEKLTPRRN